MDESARGGVELAQVGPDHVEALQAVLEAAPEHFARMTGKPRPDPDAAEREVRSAEGAEGREVALVLEPGRSEPVGALGWWTGQPEPGHALLGMLIIVRSERGRGLARSALSALESRLRAEGVSRLRTGVAARDTAAGEILRALGFESLDRRSHVAVDGGRLQLAFYEKAL